MFCSSATHYARYLHIAIGIAISARATNPGRRFCFCLQQSLAMKGPAAADRRQRKQPSSRVRLCGGLIHQFRYVFLIFEATVTNLSKTLSFFKKAAPNIKKHAVFLMVWLSHASRHGCRKQPGMVAASNRAWLPQATGHGGWPREVRNQAWQGHRPGAIVRRFNTSVSLGFFNI